jgi:hypothetical protein
MVKREIIKGKEYFVFKHPLSDGKNEITFVARIDGELSPEMEEANKRDAIQAVFNKLNKENLKLSN